MRADLIATIEHNISYERKSENTLKGRLACQWPDVTLQKDFFIAVNCLYTGNNLLLPGVETNQTSTANEVAFHSKLDPKCSNVLLF